jgi:O-antigen biosynthesis protein WbqP
MIRAFDLIGAIVASIIFFLPLFIIGILILITSGRPVIYWSERVGRNGRVFDMPKFRSMYLGAPTVSTQELDKPDRWITPLGSFLRRSSLDELPQLWSIMKGDMGFVGPRPALVSEVFLLEQRVVRGIHKLRPGITGWAQVNGRDNLSDIEKVQYDEEYMLRRSFYFDLKIMFKTILIVLLRNDILH